MFLVHPQPENKPEQGYAVRPAGILYLRETERFGRRSLLLSVSVTLCYLLFRDLGAQSVILWCLVTGIFTRVVFSLPGWIRRLILYLKVSRLSLKASRLARKASRLCGKLEEE